MPAPVPIEVTASQQRELNRIVNAKTSSQREVFRARTILAWPGDSPTKRSPRNSRSVFWPLDAGGSALPPEAWRGSKMRRDGDANRSFRPRRSDGP